MANKKTKSELDDWDWEQNDKEFYHKFLKLPESQDRKYYKAMKEHRFRNGYTKLKLDLRPRVFFNTMKVEIILLIFGISFAVSK
jgi:hypothetical protein